MRRLILLLVALGSLLLALPAGAWADGDPGSDVLYGAPLFAPADDNISPAQQNQLSKLLIATQALHVRTHVAIIGRRDDLGSITALWAQPARYAQFLGTELELEYSGRVLVVMPQGAAVYWHGHGVRTLAVTSGSRPDQLVSATAQALTRIATDAGISTAKLQQTAGSASLVSSAMSAARNRADAAIASTASSSEAGRVTGGSHLSPWLIGIGLIVVLGAVFWLPPLWRRRRALRGGGVALPGLTVGVGALVALVVLAVVIHSGRSGTANAEATNPYLSGVTKLTPAKLATDFQLTDETGHQISLRQYRGKAVILAFTDDECQTICPLTTQALVDARASLGPAAKDVQLLAVNANRKSNSVYDALTYTQMHGMLGQWHFLTGSVPQLERVWKAYGVADVISTDSNLIDHSPELYIIAPDGRKAFVSQTFSNYAAIPQYGQELAQAVSQVLPSHPKLTTRYSYATRQGISPSTRTTLPKVGGGSVTVGAGRPHLYLFFATWDAQSIPIRAEMRELNRYESYARAHGLPTVTAIDEQSVEPNARAVHTFLRGMHLNYPVAIDTTGQLADGYQIQGEPWFVLDVPTAQNTGLDPTATTPWQQEVYTQGWPSLRTLETTIPESLKPATRAQSRARIARELAGSPPALQALHGAADQLLDSGSAGLTAELRALRGHPVVVNIWASDCAPCQKEASFFGVESAKLGRRVAFLGIDYNDTSPTSARGFLARNPVSYPSYAISDGEIPTSLVKQGIEGTPTTVYIDRTGRVEYIQNQVLDSQQQLDEQIRAYAMGASN